MSKLESRAKSEKFPVDKLAGWDGLIAAAKQRIQDLEFSVKIFEQKKAAGEAVPSIPLSDSGLIAAAINETGTAKEAIPA